MNNDLISRSEQIEYFEGLARSLANARYFNAADAIQGAAEKIRNAPAVDAEPVRHGKYGFVGMDMMAGSRAFYFGTCSECHERINFEAKHKKYCPNCGAKMRGDGDA